MYSDVLSWMMKTILGISPDDNEATFEKIEVAPYFFQNLDFARGYYDAPKGRVGVAWERVADGISLKIDAPESHFVRYGGRFLPKGRTELLVKADK